MSGTISATSYPPILQQTDNPNPSTDPEKPTNRVIDSDTIPVVDLEILDSKKLGQVWREWGIFRLVNHGVPLTLLRQLQLHAKSIFGMEFEDKQRLLKDPMSYFWGTPAPGLGGPQKLNLVEGINVLVKQLPNVRTEDSLLHSFRSLLEEYGRHLGRIASTISETMTKDLKLDPIQSNLSESSGQLRIYRYPPWSDANQALGMEPHTDSSTISILNQDHVCGLQIFKDGVWLDVKPIPDSLVVNLGDLMQAISNDEYKSVTHRVQVNKHEARISICYFVFPDAHKLIHTSKYRPFTLNDFRESVREDLINTGSKIGLQHFKLPY